MDLQCNGCGGALLFNGKKNTLVCDYCGNEQSPPSGKIIKRFRLNEMFRKKKLVSPSEVSCSFCGATSPLEERQISGVCKHCGSPFITDFPSDDFEPDIIKPFILDKNELSGKVHKWSRTRFWAPSDFKKLFSINSLVPGYSPYWVYDCSTQFDYTVVLSITHRETDSNGKESTWTESWKQSGRDSLEFKDYAISSNGEMDYDLNKLGGSTEDFKVFYPEYLAGFKAKCFSLSVDECYNMFKKMSGEEIEKFIKRKEKCGADSIRIERLQVKYFNCNWRYALLPIWVIDYYYKGKRYDIVVDGSNGKIKGKSPVSWVKVLMAIILVIVGYCVFSWLKSRS